MIKVDGISKTFDSPGKAGRNGAGQKMAVDRVSFEVAEGETLILLGTSGCGKTNPLRMINRLLEPSGGNVYVNGKKVKEQSGETLRRSMGYVLQDSGLFPHYTVAENIGIVPGLLGWDKERVARRTIELLEKLHLEPGEFLHAYPGRLSGGQQQRVGLARALAADQPVLLMDEPFGALDPVTRAHVRKDFRSLDEVRKKTVVMVTHDVQEAFELGDRICLMDQGRVAQWGTPAELLFHPANAFVSSFFEGSRLQLEMGVVRLEDVWDWLPKAGGADSAATLPHGEEWAQDGAGSDLGGVTAGSSIWEVLQLTTGQPDATVQVRFKEKSIVVNSSALMTAFTGFKNK